MAADNNNFSQPFGTNERNEPNRPLDITSDLWTPISTGVPMPGTPRLYDVQSTAEPAPQHDASRKEKAGSDRHAKKRGRWPKPADAEKKKSAPSKQKKQKQKKKQRDPEAPQEPERAPKSTPVVSRAQELHRRGFENRQRRTQRQQHLRAQRSQQEYERRRQNGDSGDDIRKGSARRKRRRKQVAAVLTVCAVLVIAGLAALVYCLTYGAPVAKVVVTGDCVYSEEEIVNASCVLPGDNMFRIHTGGMNKCLCALLPYIGSVRVTYQLPDVLELEVTPTTEKYLISGKSAYLCLDDAQKILSVKKKKVQDGQFRLDGFETAEGAVGTVYQPTGDDRTRFEYAQEVVKVLLANGLEKANILDLTDPNDIIVRYDGRINIYLGTTKNLSVRLRAAAETLKNHLSDNTIGYLEITHAGKIYLYEGSMTK